ncbi:MAG TPA: prolyl oligopeptidase family serine peptidase [Myxococcota bacterium]|nr:prolyl oligopeptidase family serine peptidase [Myxococcota bacterium]
MRISIAIAILLAAGCGSSSNRTSVVEADNAATPAGEAKHAFNYPLARTVDQVDDYHGTKVPDPYRWLEDADSSDTRAWIEGENKVTFGYLENIPTRAAIKERLTARWNYERWSTPFRQGKSYFVEKNDGLQNQAVLYTMTDVAAQPKVLIDPNTLSQAGTVALADYDVSDDGKKIVYGLASAGSDWVEFHVRDVAKGTDTPDLVRWSKFSTPAFAADGSGFYYARFPEPKADAALAEANYFHKVYFHALGTDQANDVLVYEAPEHKEWMFGNLVTEDGKYLVIQIVKGTDDNNMVLVVDLARKNAKPITLIPNFDAEFAYIANDGPLFYFKTTESAPRGRIIAIDIKKPARAAWKEIVPQSEAAVETASVVGNKIFVSYMRDAKSAVAVFSMKGKRESEVALPGVGKAAGFHGERRDKETFFSFESFTQPKSIYRYDLVSGKSSVFREPKLGFDASAFETTQVFATSKDGTTKVPIFITRKKGAPLDGNAPTLLYGYGGFNIPLTPWFSVPFMTWVELGGTLAVANLRGGGEYGQDWHLAGTRDKKQNVFDDFFAAAELLTKEGYTKPSRLAIQGRSNGGLLVGAAITQRPELFGAALPAVGVMDMLRFHTFTIGRAWVDDYGSSENPREFEALRAYSPYHNVKAGTRYPPTLAVTADHDDRVVPAHSFKFMAALQSAQAGDAPVLIRIETQAGHGAGKPTTKKIEEATDEMSFAFHALGADDVVMAAVGGAATAGISTSR